jgi:hypothetical protein
MIRGSLPAIAHASSRAGRDPLDGRTIELEGTLQFTPSNRACFLLPAFRLEGDPSTDFVGNLDDRFSGRVCGREIKNWRNILRPYTIHRSNATGNTILCRTGCPF